MSSQTGAQLCSELQLNNLGMGWGGWSPMILQPRLARSGKISEAWNLKILSNHDMTSRQTFSWIPNYIYKCTSPPPKRKLTWRSCFIFERLHCFMSPGDGLSTRCGARRCLSFSPSYKQVGFYRGGCWDESWGFATRVFLGGPKWWMSPMRLDRLHSILLLWESSWLREMDWCLEWRWAFRFFFLNLTWARASISCGAF